jgi:hypothetical protein
MTSILSTYRDNQKAFEKEFGCKKNGDTYFSEYVYDTIIKPHSRTLTLSILRAVREEMPKAFEQDFIGHMCQCGNSIYCKHHNQCRTFMLQKLDAAISAIESEPN